MIGSDILAFLAEPFPPEAIEWRVGATNDAKTQGLALPYIDARDVQDRLSQVCGINWQTRHHSCGGDKLGCDIGIKIGDEWIWRGDGAGSTDFEAEKGAFSDAFKRAAVHWGIGRYLYNLKSKWVPIEQRGKSYIISDKTKQELRKELPVPKGRPSPRDEAAVGFLSSAPQTQYVPKTHVRPPSGIETPMPQGAMIRPGQVWAVDTADPASLAGADAKAFAKAAAIFPSAEPITSPPGPPAEPASKPSQPRRAMGGPAPSLLQRATAEADRGTFTYEYFWTEILGPDERKELGAEVHQKLKALADLADKMGKG